MELSLENIINVSVATAQTGVGELNTSNVALFTPETYGGGFGDDGYKIYLSPTEVEEDFGSDSQTYAMALALFSQKPNILLNGGYLVVIPTIVEVQTITPSVAPASGTYELNFDGDVTAAINWNDTAEQIQTKIRTLTGLEEATVTGTLATLITVTFKGYYGSAALMTVTNNTLNGGITLTVAEVTDGETLSEAIARTEDLVQYFGLALVGDPLDADIEAAATVVQALQKMYFYERHADDTVVEDGGVIYDLAEAGMNQSRGLYREEDSLDAALEYVAAYMGRALSTVFTGSNTTSTMHMKSLTGIEADPDMTQTIANKCKLAGADFYASFQGVAKNFCTKGNVFFDRIYNRLAFVIDITVNQANILMQTDTKIPQTEAGMDLMKSGARSVCQQYVRNQFLAPGEWDNPTTFGNQADLYDNVRQVGFYVYSQPIALQSAADREDREAPLMQIAIKEAGAIQSASIVVNVNA